MVNYETTENSLFQYWLTGNQSMLHPCEIVQVIKFLITICSCCRSMVLNHCSWDKHCWNMFMHIGYKLWIKIVMWNLLVLLCIRGIYIYQKKITDFLLFLSCSVCLVSVCLSSIEMERLTGWQLWVSLWRVQWRQSSHPDNMSNFCPHSPLLVFYLYTLSFQCKDTNTHIYNSNWNIDKIVFMMK